MANISLDIAIKLVTTVIKKEKVIIIIILMTGKRINNKYHRFSTNKNVLVFIYSWLYDLWTLFLLQWLTIYQQKIQWFKNLEEECFTRTRGLSRGNMWSPQDFDLWPTWMKISNGTSTHDGKQFCQVSLKSIHNCRRYGPDKFERMHTCTDAHTHLHQTEVVTTMPRSLKVGSTKTL